MTETVAERSYTDIFFKEFYFTDFYCFNVGHEVCQPGYRFGPALREHYVLHLVVKGQGRYQTPDKHFAITAGQFFLIRPHELTDYQADFDDPWEYYWLGFSGKKAAELLQLTGLASGAYVGTVADLQETVAGFKRFLQADFYQDAQKLPNQALFLTLFQCFRLTNQSRGQKNPPTAGEKYREAFLLYVAANYAREELSIQEIAQSMYLHPAYFSQVIKTELGMTAMAYLQDYRLHQAGALLSASDLSIEEIATAVGYQSRHSFTRAFKKKFKRSPSQYRETT